MFLTQVKLDKNNPHTLYALRHRNSFHGAIRHATIQVKPPLWRIDTLGGQPYLLIASELQPDLNLLTDQFCSSSKDARTADYAILLKRITVGSKWHFRLVAYPRLRLRSLSVDGRSGKEVSCLSDQEQLDWLEKRESSYGFRTVPGTVEIRERTWETIRKADNNRKTAFKFLAVTYEGVLEVTDSELFKIALTEGIGQKKAYGMGLLTVARMKQSSEHKD